MEQSAYFMISTQDWNKKDPILEWILTEGLYDEWTSNTFPIFQGRWRIILSLEEFQLNYQINSSC